MHDKNHTSLFFPLWKTNLLLFTIFLFSCTTNPPDIVQLKNEIISADKSMSDLAAKEGFNKALLLYADDDFVKFNPGSHPAIGKKEFAKQVEGNAGTKFLSWEPVKAEVAMSGELGYTWGNWKLLLPDTVLYGNYFTVWKKQKDGSWKMALDGGNNTPPPKASS